MQSSHESQRRVVPSLLHRGPRDRRIRDALHALTSVTGHPHPAWRSKDAVRMDNPQPCWGTFVTILEGCVALAKEQRLDVRAHVTAVCRTLEAEVLASVETDAPSLREALRHEEEYEAPCEMAELLAGHEDQPSLATLERLRARTLHHIASQERLLAAIDNQMRKLASERGEFTRPMGVPMRVAR